MGSANDIHNGIAFWGATAYALSSRSPGITRYHVMLVGENSIGTVVMLFFEAITIGSKVPR